MIAKERGGKITGSNNAPDLRAQEYPEDYFRLHQRRYLLQDALSQRRILDVLSSLRPRPGERILDVGCGIGVISLESRKRGALLTGIDYSATAIKIARQLELAILGKNEIEYLCLPITDIPSLSPQFDKVVCADFVEHISRELFELFLDRVQQVMKAGSLLVIYTPNGQVIEPTRWQKALRLFGLLPLFRHDDITVVEKRHLAQRWYRLDELENVPDEEFERFHVDLKPAAYLAETLNDHGFRVTAIKVTRSSSLLQKMPYPFNILWGGHLCLSAKNA